MDHIVSMISEMEMRQKDSFGYSLLPEFEKLVKCMMVTMAKSTNWQEIVTSRVYEKNEKDSIKFRGEGNESFEAGDDVKAIESYTKSLAYSNTNELKAYAHACRSAALYRLKMFDECLIDIKAAIELDCPEEKRHELEGRKLEAIREIDKSLNAEETIEDDKPNSGSLTGDIEKMSIGNSSLLISENFPMKPRYLQNPEVMTLIYGPNKENPGRSNGVKILFSKEYGRHCVALREFKPGDLLTIEDPFLSVVYVDKFYTHCQHCFTRCLNLIPCTRCPLAQYCSKKCRESSWEAFHRFECPILGIVVNQLDSDEENVRLAMQNLRLLSISTSNGQKIESLRENMENAEVNEDTRTTGFIDNGLFDGENIRSFLSLATNVMVCPMTDIIFCARLSAMTVILLSTRTTFFGRVFELQELMDINLHQDITFCGALMAKAGLINETNTFNVQPGDGTPKDRFGSAVYVAHSRYNHSCAPNTFRYFQGRTLITRAAEPIHPGQQIFIKYMAMYTTKPKDERRAKLKEIYFIDCQCRACVNNWPTVEESFKNLDCPNSKEKQLTKSLEPYKQRLQKNKYDFDAIKKILTIFYQDESIEEPGVDILNAAQLLKDFFLDP